MKNKLTFKRHPKETGLRKVTYPHPYVDIKLKGNVVGQIVPPSAFSRHHKFLIRLMEIDSTQRSGWKWVQLKYQGDTEQDVRDFVTKLSETIQAKYQLYSHTD